MSRKVVYLFGAGAVFSWNAPTTSDLTKLVLNSGFFCNNTNKRVTKIIFETLSDHYPADAIDFETILNVIEELLVLYSSRNYIDTNSLLFPFIKSRCLLDEIFNFEINGEVKHGFSLIIPNHVDENIKHAYQNQSPKQFYLQLLYANILSTISLRVSKYSYHTVGNSKIETIENQQLNHCFSKWINTEIENESTVRLYTLNYDRLFSVILKQSGVSIFEGVECVSELTKDDKLPFDINRIATDFDCNVYYNLHGSSFWDIQVRNQNQLPSVEFFMTGAPRLSSNLWEQPIMQIEKGKIINPSNIITGYQKTQKTSISPFRQIQSAFDRDCLEANKIVIVGYSFGDVHLNETIRMVLIHNPDAEIIIIDPNFRKNKLDEKIGIELLSNSLIQLSPTNLTENSCSFLGGKVIVHENNFDDYLKERFINKE